MSYPRIFKIITETGKIMLNVLETYRFIDFKESDMYSCTV